ncbi:hypothetical protein [Desulfolithobacter sp.]
MTEHGKRLATLVVTAMILLLPAGPGWALGVITGRYTTTPPTQLALQVTIKPPAPASLIVIQHLPPGIEIVSSSPVFKKYNRRKGTVRWLFRDLEPGEMTIHLTLKTPTPPGQVRAEIRYKDPETGKMMTIHIP